MIHIALKALGLAAAIGLSGLAHAALIDRGNGLIYDDVLKVTWLQDANYAKTSGYDADGQMTWAAATAWAANLSYAGFSDWRLPTMLDTGVGGCNSANVLNDYNGSDCGYNVDTVIGGVVYSELAYMYYVNLDLKAAYSRFGIDQYGLTGEFLIPADGTLGLIRHLQVGEYWTGVPRGSTRAWGFSTLEGLQYDDFLTGLSWAVSDGDIAAPATGGGSPTPTPGRVPEPATGLLAGVALAWLAVSRRRAGA